MAKSVKKFYDIVDDEVDNTYTDSTDYEEGSYDNSYDEEQEYYEEEQEHNYDEEYEEEEQEDDSAYENRPGMLLRILMVITYCIVLILAFYGIYSIACLFTF